MAVTVFLLLIAVRLALAQTPYVDSLQQLLKSARHDTARVRLYFALSQKLTPYSIPTATSHLETGYAIARRLQDKYYIAYYYRKKAALLWELAEYSSSSAYFDTAIVIFDELLAESGTVEKKHTYLFEKTDCLIGKGLLAAKKFNFHESTQIYQEAIAGIEQIPGNKKNALMATLYADIASNYYELDQFELSLAANKKLLPYIDPNDNIDLYVIGNLFVADDFASLSHYDSSAFYLEKVTNMVIKLKKPSLDIRYYQTLGTIRHKRKNWPGALQSFQKAYAAAIKQHDIFQAMSSQEGMAAALVQQGGLVEARKLALQVLAESKRLQVPLGRVRALQLLTDIEELSGNINAAFGYQKELLRANDSLQKQKMQQQMHEIEARYETEKKQRKIAELQKSNSQQVLSLQRKSMFNYILAGSLVALVVTGFLGYRIIRNRQQLAWQQAELQRQRIKELEKDKQLVAVDSMLKGQEDERRRLARDLHDGLGGLLSGVKYGLSNMKDNLIVTPDNMAVFERSLDMLDTSIRELRRVAHNMMPEMLAKFGLDEAVKEFCNTVNETRMLVVNYQSVGMETRLDPAIEIIIYRVIQELLNNILKHAGASQAYIQVIRQNNRLNIGVEDNGKGFQTADLEKSKGAGWVNIRSRVEYLKGQFDVHSEPGKGTLVNIEFNLQQYD